MVYGKGFKLLLLVVKEMLNGNQIFAQNNFITDLNAGIIKKFSVQNTFITACMNVVLQHL